MRDRLLALFCGALLGTALRAGWERAHAPGPQVPPQAAAAQPIQMRTSAPEARPGIPARCASHPIKMPCLSDQ